MGELQKKKKYADIRMHVCDLIYMKLYTRKN